MNTREHEGGEPEQEFGNLGSLAQSARLKHLNSARRWLIAIGIITMLVNGVQLAMARDLVEQDIKKRGMVIVNKDEFEKGLVIVRLILAIPLALGALFIVLGLMVKSYPV